MELLLVALVALGIGAYLRWGRTSMIQPAADGPLPDSLEAYRLRHPSNFHLNQPTCCRCGSRFVSTQGRCNNCGATLFRR